MAQEVDIALEGARTVEQWKYLVRGKKKKKSLTCQILSDSRNEIASSGAKYSFSCFSLNLNPWFWKEYMNYNIYESWT